MAFVAKLPDTKVQAGAPASALSVRQMPPPAAPSQTRQVFTVQLGAMASAVMRPEVTYGAPLKVRTAG